MTVREFIPREHGAWAMWIVPMLSAAVVTSFSLRFFLLFVCFTLLYIVHHPIVLLSKRKSLPDRKALGGVLAVGIPGILIGLAIGLLAKREWLLGFGAAEALIFVSSVKAFVGREQRSFMNELLIVFSLTLSAPAAYYVITGKLDAGAAKLFVLNFLFFASSVFFVKMKIEFLRTKGVWRGKAREALITMIAYHLFLVAIVLAGGIAHVISSWLILGYLPILVQVSMGTLSKELKVNFTRLGIFLAFESAWFLCALGLFLK